MDLLAATEAFTKFEGHRLAELLADDVDLEDAQRIVLEQWQCMDEAGRRHWAAPSGAPTPIRRRAEGTAKRARRDVWRCLEVLEESSSEEISEELGAQRAFKRSSVVVGGKHPDWLTEPAAVAEISLPQLSEDDVVQVPREVVEKRLLSGPQLESVAYAARRFRTYLPSGVRAGYYLGDGTGCGKGRVIAALAWHLWNTGARRHLWLSAASDLQVDAARDFRDLGASLPLCKLSDMPYGLIGCKKGLDAQGNGIIFASYHLLVASKATASEHSPESSRLGQLIHWLREDPKGGLIALDEAHRAKNVAAGKASASKSGLAALELQRACPHCCVLYASATGASELRHLGYLERLGLWGPGRPHGSFEELMKAVEGGGLAAMELLAMTMRAEGMLSCRSLSFKGAAFRLVPIGLESLRESYERACDFWQSSLRVAKALLKERTQQVKRMRLKHSTELKENALHMRYFWSAQQQFFRQLLICFKVDTAVSLASSAQLRGESVVLAMWSTGEAITEAVAERQELDGFASAPKEVARRMLQGLGALAAELSSSEQAVEALETALEALELPVNPMDELLRRLGGPEKVAELTGRQRRPLWDGRSTRLEERGEGANLLELEAFQSGRKQVAIITEAASAGISLHCDRRLPEEAQRPRYMISIEMPWEADKAIQQLGRVHRSNQKVPPRFAFLVTDLGGEVRFASSVARRLRILGAVMRGDRNSAHGLLDSLEHFDIQNRYGRRALARVFELLRTGQQPEVDFSFLQCHGGKSCWRRWEDFQKQALKALDLIGLRPDTEDKYEESLAESKSLNVFLNRLLMLEPTMQNALFQTLAEVYMQLVSADRDSGAYDGGPEILDQRRGTKTQVELVHREVLFTDPMTGAETAYARLRRERGMSFESAAAALEDGLGEGGEGFYWCSETPLLALQRPDEDLDLHWPQGCGQEKASLSGLQAFRRCRPAELCGLEATWRRLHGSGQWEEEHVLTGSILSTWAVLGTALAAKQRIPLVRARLLDGGAIVGVRVRSERLQEVRYVLSALHDQKSQGENTQEAQLSDVRRLSAELEALLRSSPDRRCAWQGWAGAHEALVARGLVAMADGLRLAQEAFADLERNGKLEVSSDGVQLREKVKGQGWYIPPPKKPRPKRGRGRGR